jgi:uncharacterized protein YjbI with pentapeptide repeats
MAMLLRADLREANLAGAFRTDADLREADLRGAVLGGADLTGAITSGARFGVPAPSASRQG